MTTHLTLEQSAKLRAHWLAHCESSVCTPSAQPEASRVPPTDSALGESFTPYVFTYEVDAGPTVELFDEKSHLEAFARGWAQGGGIFYVETPHHFRGVRS